MNDDICKTCGSQKVFVGGILDGRLVCQHCAQVEFHPDPVAALKDEEDPRKFEDKEFDDYGD